MKYLRGYFTAGIFAGLAYVLMRYAQRFSTLVDMVYPYVIRNFQSILAQWSSQVDFCIWQVAAVFLGVLVLASLVLMIIFKWNPIQWAGWVLAGGAFIYLLHTLVFGLNYYAGDLSDDIRMEVSRYTLSELEEATGYYRDKANELASQVTRDAVGSAVFSDFDTLANQAGDGFQYLTYTRHYSVFAGSTLPVKKLGWSDMYTSMGITGFTFGITGEAAVNPQAPQTSLPFTMCHEMAHRMCIASERDANFAAFLAATSNSSVEFRYSGYFMAYRYCYNSLASVSREAAGRISAGASALLQQDMAEYDNFYNTRKSESNTKLADTVNDTYLKTSGETAGIASYGQVCDLLVNWHVQEVVLPSLTVETSPFDPYDTNQVDLSDILIRRGA